MTVWMSIFQAGGAQAPSLQGKAAVGKAGETDKGQTAQVFRACSVKGIVWRGGRDWRVWVLCSQIWCGVPGHRPINAPCAFTRKEQQERSLCWCQGSSGTLGDGARGLWRHLPHLRHQSYTSCACDHVTQGHGIFFRNRSKLMSETFYVLTKSHPNKLFHFFPLDNTTHKSLIRACAHRELPLFLRKSVHLWILGFCRAISKGVFVDVLKHLATVHIFLAKDELITFK